MSDGKMVKREKLDDGEYLYGAPGELYARGHDFFDSEAHVYLRVPSGLIEDGSLARAVREMLKPEYRFCLVDTEDTGMAYVRVVPERVRSRDPLEQADLDMLETGYADV